MFRTTEIDNMQRKMVQVMKVRMRDVLPGDVVNKNADEPKGWIEVLQLQELPNNGIVLAAESDRDSINGNLNDVVGVQIIKTVDVPDAPQQRAA